MAKPLLIVSDGVTAGTGLARITRDLAIRIASKMPDVYRIATAGPSGSGSRSLLFQQYFLEGVSDFVCPTLPDVWGDFAGTEKGIILFVWDASRLGWISQPDIFPELTEKFPALQQWAKQRSFELWGYLPIDASGPDDKLTFPVMKTLLGFDRLIAYGPFGEDVIRKTIGDEESDKRHLTNIPHGIDTDVFFQIDRKNCRKMFFKHTGADYLIPIQSIAPLAKEECLIGIVATNQTRKDWALGLKAVSLLAQTRPVRVWIHTDELERYWSIPSLLVDFGLIDKAVVSLGNISDDRLAEAYTACDITLGIGPEGFGYPIAESQACGTPVITGSYAGGADIVPQTFHVQPIGFRYEGVYVSKRPVYHAQDWATKMDQILRIVHRNGVILNARYDWNNLWPEWEAYLRRAAE